MIKTTVTYYPNDWIEVHAELAIRGHQSTCRISHIGISRGCRDFEINIERLEKKIVEYYLGNFPENEQDAMTQSKRQTEYQMMEGAG